MDYVALMSQKIELIIILSHRYYTVCAIDFASLNIQVLVSVMEPSIWFSNYNRVVSNFLISDHKSLCRLQCEVATQTGQIDVNV
jgi:hypothetical protein